MASVKPVTVREGSPKETAALSNQNLSLPGDYEKLTQVRDTSSFILPSGTHWVERDVLGISQQVHEVTEGKCRVASCSCGKCVSAGHFPHVVLEKARDGSTQPVFGFTRFGPHVVERLRQSHISQNPNKKSEQNNEKLREVYKKQANEARREKLDIIETALRSHKLDWKGPGNMRASSRSRLL